MWLKWRRAAPNVWVAGDYAITRQWLHDAKRGRRYEARYPNGAMTVCSTLTMAKELCRIHAAMVDLALELELAVAKAVKAWRAMMLDLAAASQQMVDKLQATIRRR